MASQKCPNSMRLFGIPHQFINTADPRYSDLSLEVGRSFIDHIIEQAYTVYLIPGVADFLPGENGSEAKQGALHAFLEAANGQMNPLKEKLANNPTKYVRFYDFKEDYNEYIKYVNIMCRTAATFLELPQSITVGGSSVPLQQYDWKNYRWTKDRYEGAALSQTSYLANNGLSIIGGVLGNVVNAARGRSLSPLSLDPGYAPESWTNNYLQFYMDPESSSSRSFSNTTGASSIKSMLDTGTNAVREWQFIANSAGVQTEGVQEFASSAVSSLDEMVNDMPAIGSILSRILSVAPAIISGENVVLPDVYQGSEYMTDYTITIKLASPYGNKLAIYMNIIVPLLHLIALVAARQSTSNSAGAPFMVKAFCPGVFNVNLGIVESLQVTSPSSADAYSVDGLPTEVDVQVRIKDLYSDLSLSKSTEAELFANNSSMIDFLATTCGLSLIEPQISAKLNMRINAFTSSLMDIPSNAGSMINDYFEKKLAGFVTLR